ncbi:hypothetical protein P7C70_g7523, partial [Phenoliferia sp. Uapishka_3]
MSPTTPIRFVRFQPDLPRDVAELERQRVLCGWGLEHVPVWRDEVRRGDKGLFWIFPKPGFEDKYPVPDDEPLNLEDGQGPAHPDPSFRPLGHISLDWTDYMNDNSLANRDEGLLTLATFFILVSQHGRGLGNAAMDEAEALAASPVFAAKFLTLNTMLGKNTASQEWNERVGIKYNPGARVNQNWYRKRGYVEYKEEPRYHFTNPGTGVSQVLEAVFMKRDLASGVH